MLSSARANVERTYPSHGMLNWGAHLLAMMGWPHYLDHLGDYRNELPVVTPISE